MAVFVDANILIYCAKFRKSNSFAWLNDLYQTVYIHQMVLDEVVENESRSIIESAIESFHWKIFDPDDELELSYEEYKIYEFHLETIKRAFQNLDKKKEVDGRQLKGTNDLGEMHSLAAALFLDAQIICSNDYDIREVIQDNQLRIQYGNQDALLRQDTLVDFCYLLITHSVEKPSLVRKFLKATQPSHLPTLESLLKQS